MCNIEDYPKACCDVMVSCKEIEEMAYMLFDTTSEASYVDIYATIEPERKVVTELNILCKDEDGTQDGFDMKITDPADGIEYFKQIEDQGGDEFKEFIDDALALIHTKKLEMTDSFVEVFEDFLEKRNVRIPTSDQAMKDAGDDPKVNSARIYGDDYFGLCEDAGKVLGISDKNVLIDRLKYLGEWAEKYYPDEQDFYMEIEELKATRSDLEEAWGIEQASHVEEAMEEYGLELARVF